MEASGLAHEFGRRGLGTVKVTRNSYWDFLLRDLGFRPKYKEEKLPWDREDDPICKPQETGCGGTCSGCE